MDGDLISRKELRDLWLYNGLNEHIYCTNDVLDSIDEQPAVDAEPVRHGMWRHLGGDEWRCTMCGEVIHTEGTEKPEDKYCRECGTRMDGGD